MTNRRVFKLAGLALLIVLPLAGCQAVQSTSKRRAVEAELTGIETLLPGRYSGNAPDTRPGRTGVHVVYHKIVPIDAPQFGANVQYHQISAGGFDGEPLQQKIYVFDMDPTRVENSSRSFIIFPGQAIGNLEQHGPVLRKLKPETLFQFPESCRLKWRAVEQGFEARVDPKECVYASSAFGGRVRPDMVYEVTADYFSLTETIYRDSGEVIVTTNGTLKADRTSD